MTAPGTDYHEVCVCGASLTIKDTTPSTLEKLVADWRTNHICPFRSGRTQLAGQTGKYRPPAKVINVIKAG